MTTYTFHYAYDHSIVAAFAEAEDLAKHAKAQAELDAEQTTKTRRYYVHNGTGIVAAFLTRNGDAHQILRNDYMQFKDSAAKRRAEAQL